MEELTLIKTPNSYIKLGATRTLLQQDSLLMVSAHLQEYVKTFFELGLHHSGARIRPLFTKYVLEHGIPPFKIYLADMGIKAQNYQTVREAIAEMNVVVEHAELDDEGHKTGGTIFSPVFKQFRVPEHYGYIEVEINNNVAQYAFDMAQGYISHPKLIARYATKRSTPPLYFKLLMEHRTVVRLSVPEVKKAIGMEPFRDDKTGEWVVPYAKFAHFKTKVLDPVKADLDQMAADGHADITFTYTSVYFGDRRRGDPDHIEFIVKRIGRESPHPVEGDLFAAASPAPFSVGGGSAAATSVPTTSVPTTSVPATSAPATSVPDGSTVGMTKDKAQEAYLRCYPDFKTQLGLSGADVWLSDYHDGTATFAYDPSVGERLVSSPVSDTFSSIVKKHFGQNIVIKYRQSGC